MPEHVEFTAVTCGRCGAVKKWLDSTVEDTASFVGSGCPHCGQSVLGPMRRVRVELIEELPPSGPAEERG